MALSSKLTTTFYIANRNEKKINFTKYFSNALAIKQPTLGLIGLIPKAIPIDPSFVNELKTITINRVVRRMEYSQDLQFENEDGTKTLTLPAVSLSKIDIGDDFSPEFQTGNIVIDNFDAKSVKWLSAVGDEYRNFLNSYYMKMTYRLYDLLKDDATNAKLFANRNQKAIKDTDKSNQPAALSGNSRTTALTIAKIKAGRRINVVNDSYAEGNGFKLLDACIDYFWDLGGRNSTEPSYPYAVNGYDRSDLVIVASRKFRNSLTSGDVKKFVPADKRTGYKPGFDSYDGIQIMVDKDIPADTDFIVFVKETAFYIEPDNAVQTVGEYRQGGYAPFVDPADSSKQLFKEILPTSAKILWLKNFYLVNCATRTNFYC